jgi:glucose/arabinose dehydrogenase
MYQRAENELKKKLCSQTIGETERYLNPADINISPGYRIEVFVQGLDSPISMFFTENEDMIVAESGLTSGNPRVLLLVNDHFEVIAENFRVPITGTNYLKGSIYVSHRGFVSTVTLDGTRQNIITGLPSNGDYYNSRVVIGPDNKIYFGQGTVTNSGVVGPDNDWVTTNPLLCDYPGDYIMLVGQNYESYNIAILEAAREIIYTGGFSPYGVPNLPYEVRKGVVKASGGILRANLDGTELELFAWGFRNPAYIKFDQRGRLFVSNNGYEVRGSRPIANAYDEFYNVEPGVWHGWPDYSGGEPVNTSRFTPEGGILPEFLLKSHPNIPPLPFVTFPTNSNIMGFDFNYNSEFGPYGNIYIAEFGSRLPVMEEDSIPYSSMGHRISRIDNATRTVNTFAMNKSGFPASITSEGGFERLSEIVFGPDGAMYVLDSGVSYRDNPNAFIPQTGVIWRISRK